MLYRTARLLLMWVLPCPFNEGKTASGQVEMLQLYHRISVVPKGFPRRKQPSDFDGESTRFSATINVARINHLGLHIPKSPADPWPISGSVRAISLLIVVAPVSGKEQSPGISPGVTHMGVNTGRAAHNPFAYGLLTGALTLHPARSNGHLN
jgi:hypothetical protein